jgi:uncharacterized MAPEG superfamily protein
MVDAGQYKDTLLVTLVYFIMYYSFLTTQAIVHGYLYVTEKKRAKAAKGDADSKEKVSFRKVKYESKHKMGLLVDRTTGNCLEQMVPFLFSLWAHAIFVSSQDASFIGIIYIVSRSAYPFCFYLGLPWVLISTVPGYLCVSYLLGGVIVQLYTSH